MAVTQLALLPSPPPLGRSSPRGSTSAEVAAAAAFSRKTKRGTGQWRLEKRYVIGAIATAARGHNAPPLDNGGKQIVASLVGILLNGGYSLPLITRVAVNAALEYDEVRRYSKLFQLRMRVRAAQADIDLDAHTKQKLEERSPFPMATIADVKRLDPRRVTQEMAITAAERALYAPQLPAGPHREREDGTAPFQGNRRA